jgi:uncharacterized protein (TIGR03083 family)
MSNPVWPMLAAERSALVAYLPTLSAGDWNCPSPCAGWSVHDLVVHVVAGASTTPLKFAPAMIASGFSFDRLAARGIRQGRDASPTELIAALRGRVDAKTQPGQAYLGEMVVHSEDIRRAVGAPSGDHPAPHLTMVADYYAGSGGPVGGKKRVAGLKLSATDLEWSTGSGPEVEGPLVSLIMAICGRGFALDELKGPGADQLAARI